MLNTMFLNIRNIIIVVVLFLNCLQNGTTIHRTSNIEFQHNGYSNVLIAMHESVPDSTAFITKTQVIYLFNCLIFIYSFIYLLI